MPIDLDNLEIKPAPEPVSPYEVVDGWIARIRNEDQCPKCGCDELHRDEVDVGVGIIYGPYGCPECGWSESEAYDLSEMKSPLDEKGGAIDQYGGYHPPGSSMALAYRLAEEENRA